MGNTNIIAVLMLKRRFNRVVYRRKERVFDRRDSKLPRNDNSRRGRGNRHEVPRAQHETGDGRHGVNKKGMLCADQIGGQVVETGAENVPAWSSCVPTCVPSVEMKVLHMFISRSDSFLEILPGWLGVEERSMSGIHKVSGVGF